MEKFSKYVGLDTHKETIAVSVADAAGGRARYYGELANRPAAVAKLIKRMSPDGEVVSFCYEAGPCGYELYRQITQTGHDCVVVAPSLIPTRPGDRVKTDRRDSEALARLHRAGELTPVWVPDEEQEAIRDLTRAREDMKLVERQLRQRLNAFLLRHGCPLSGQKQVDPSALALAGATDVQSAGTTDRAAGVHRRCEAPTGSSRRTGERDGAGAAGMDAGAAG
jgi:transposase